MASVGNNTSSAATKGEVNDKGSTPVSPSISSDHGGARLDVHLDDLSLEDSPTRASTVYEPPHYLQGNGTPEFAENLGASVSQDARVFQIGSSRDEDVFTSKALEIIPPPSSAIPAAALGSNSLALGPRSFSYANVASSPIPIRGARNRPSDIGSRHQIAGVDAQAYYPPSACVFVANLPESKPDHTLEASITKAFATFGPVFVKIRRDSKNMPFAFCQYTNSEHAEKAMRQGKGLLIEGRACRTEMVKANRSYVMFSTQGHEIEVEEAENQLSQFGPIEKCERLRPELQEVMNLPGAVFVQYQSFDPARDIIATYRHNAQYRVIAYDLKKATQPKVDPDMEFLQRYEIDRRSIYMGNLPVDVANIEEIIKDCASKIGDVERVQVIRKEARVEHNHPVVFAFVQFSRPNEAEKAVNSLRGTTLCGSQIKVERKNSRETQALQQGTRRIRSTHVPLDNKGSDMSKVEGQNTPASKNTKETSMPVTPLRTSSAENPASQESGNVSSSTPQPHIPYNSYGYMPMGSQSSYMSPGYGASPMSYNTHYTHSGYPVTPQGTPGVGNPYGGSGYYPGQYSWPTPYLQDPTFPQMSYYHAYTSPSPYVPSRTVDETDTSNSPDKASIGTGESTADSYGQGDGA
ncbi:hypothetical protein F5X96DRAFT_685290 [Biscogniauxia mediterranea]|nr:hypothetical protein F5X96DRAFT_685290 [Biscogniauxia mediterranea]